MYVGSRQELPSDLSIWNGSTVPAPVISGLTTHGPAIFPIERPAWAPCGTPAVGLQRAVNVGLPRFLILKLTVANVPSSAGRESFDTSKSGPAGEISKAGP